MRKGIVTAMAICEGVVPFFVASVLDGAGELDVDVDLDAEGAATCDVGT